MAVTAKGKRPIKQARGYGAYAIYTELRNEILALELEPGQLVDESSLAKRFEVSRSPVREALVRLVSDNLLQTLPNKGTIVAPLRIEEFPQYVDALDLMQRATTRLAAEFRSQDDLQHMRAFQAEFVETLKTGDVLGMIQKNRDFHVAIGRASRNTYIASAYERILDDGRRFLRLYFKSFGDVMPTSMADSHEAIIAAIEAGDLDLSERLAQEHTEEVQQRFLQYLGSRRMMNFTISKS
ncbi:MAG: GntR family transcriptional regulator [Pseudomonadota bacterium]